MIEGFLFGIFTIGAGHFTKNAIQADNRKTAGLWADAAVIFALLSIGVAVKSVG